MSLKTTTAAAALMAALAAAVIAQDAGVPPSTGSVTETMGRTGTTPGMSTPRISSAPAAQPAPWNTILPDSMLRR